ncbi:vanin-like protein 1 [Eurosta solidaginis]|uniref:vanin-like protein 1 n=1 Tax=Eurosta solidaginis TaxID=178769 RepID=UPI003530F8C2
MQNIWSKLIFFVVTVGPQLAWQLSLPSDPTYKAGVVEFIPGEGQGYARVEDALPRMKAIIESNATRDLDILVFPEYVLNNVEARTFVPDPSLKISPCEIPDYDLFLTEISCAVRSRQVYVVMNLMEKVFCANDTSKVGTCDPSGLNSYNTNVVFDRQGRVISRYRKSHLYKYEWYSEKVMPQPEKAIFTTDFGVTFGHFICFDMLYWDPAQVLVKEHGVTEIIFPTYWFSELPFLMAVPLQEGWAFANDVNLLGADASKPSGQNGGSGIYAGRMGRLTAAMYEEPTTRVLTATVPKRSQRDKYRVPPVDAPAFKPQIRTPRLTKFDLLRDYNVDIFKTQLLPADFKNVKETVCYDNEFCCQFEATRVPIAGSSNFMDYRYRLGAFSGSHATHQRVDFADLKVCAVFACTNEELYSCGYIFPENDAVGNKFYFSSLKVSGSFAHAPRRLIMPLTVDGALMPLPLHMLDWQEVESSDATSITINLTSPKEDLLTFAIWGNYYTERVSKHNFDPVWQRSQTDQSTQTDQSAPKDDQTNSGASLYAGVNIIAIFLLGALINF